MEGRGQAAGALARLAGLLVDIGAVVMGLGSALLAAVQPGGGQPPLHLLPPPAHYARSLALSMGRRGAMMAVYSFRRSTRS